MTACTEPHPAWATHSRDGEGQKGMPKTGTAMTACTEPHPAWATHSRDGEGCKDLQAMPKEIRA